MLPREDFVFTIGYDGPVAVVDNQAKRKYGKFSTRELAEKGLFRAAYSSAVYSKDSRELRFVVEAYNSLGEHPSAELSKAELSTADLSVSELSAMDRLFGVSLVDVKRSLSL